MAADDEHMATYREIQSHMQQLLQTRSKFAQQDTENKLVQSELDQVDDGSTVYKLVGPLLLEQELSGVKHNVGKRLEFIAAEIEKVDKQLETKQKEQQDLVQKITGQQQDMRRRAAEEARKVFEEQVGGGGGGAAGGGK